MQAGSDSSLPETTNLHHLISSPYELDQDGYAGQTGPLLLSIPYDPAALPEGVSHQALTIVWWDGQSWQDVASTVDEGRSVIEAEIHHFSTFADLDSDGWTRGVDSSPEVVDALIDRLGRLGRKRFAAWLHLMDPHLPYAEHEYNDLFSGAPVEGLAPGSILAPMWFTEAARFRVFRAKSVFRPKSRATVPRAKIPGFFPESRLS